MFAGLVNQAKAAASGFVLKYVARASVGIPFVIAFGFALAAITVTLVEHFGHLTAYWIMAGGLAVIGVIAAIAVSMKEHQEEVAEQKVEASDTQAVVRDTTAQALTQAPLALLGALFTAPGGATTALKGARTLGRNWPLLLLLAMVAALFWPAEDTSEEAEVKEREGKPNGFHPAETLH